MPPVVHLQEACPTNGPYLGQGAPPLGSPTTVQPFPSLRWTQGSGSPSQSPCPLDHDSEGLPPAPAQPARDLGLLPETMSCPARTQDQASRSLFSRIFEAEGGSLRKHPPLGELAERGSFPLKPALLKSSQRRQEGVGAEGQTIPSPGFPEPNKRSH